MKKILVVCSTDTMIRDFLIPHINYLIGQGHIVECACRQTDFSYGELEKKHGYVMHDICFERSPFKRENYKAYKQLLTLVKEENFDIIHCHQPVGGAIGRLVGHKAQKKVIYISHGFHFFTGAPIKHWLMYYLSEKFLSRYTDAILTINKEDYNRAFKFHAKNVYLIPGIGVDFKKNDIVLTEEEKSELRKEIGVKENDIVMISIGEMTYRKNHEIVIRALSSIKESRLKYLIIGGGELGDYLKELSIKENVADRVIFAGYKKDAIRYLRIGDFGILPSLWEGLGFAGIETILAGLPLIASNRHGILDYVIDNKTGFLIDPLSASSVAESINKVLALKDKARLVDNARKTIEQYSLENSIKVMAEINAKEIGD